MRIFERRIGGKLYRIASQAVWNASKQQAYPRQVVLGPAEAPPMVDLAATRKVGTRRVGDVGALVWVAEQLDAVAVVDRACGVATTLKSPSVGEMVLAVAVQRACAPGAKRDLTAFLEGSVPRVSCLPGKAFSGQAFHRLATRVTSTALEQAQLALARAAVQRFGLGTSVLAFDTTNFDTHIATTTAGQLARRGHAKSKRSDLRVVGLAVLVSETGHVPLLHRTYPGNSSDQQALEECLEGLGQLHDVLDTGEGHRRPAQRTLVRDGGSWGERLELELDVTGYFTLVSLPLGNRASANALDRAARPRAMRKLSGPLRDVRAARMTERVGALKRTLVVVESKELLQGQKRGIAAALRKAKEELHKLQHRAVTGRIDRPALERSVQKALAREHLAEFVVADVQGSDEAPTLNWHVDATRRRKMERSRLGKRVLCTDRHIWRTEQIVQAFRGQSNVEELFRRSKKGGIVAWGPSFQWTDTSLRLHTFATVVGLMLVSLAKIALGTTQSARAMMRSLAAIDATLVRTATGAMGRRPTFMLAPELSAEQVRAVRIFELERWFPSLLSSRL